MKLTGAIAPSLNGSLCTSPALEESTCVVGSFLRSSKRKFRTAGMSDLPRQNDRMYSPMNMTAGILELQILGYQPNGPKLISEEDLHVEEHHSCLAACRKLDSSRCSGYRWWKLTLDRVSIH
jgi:hypothetical protein